MNLKGCINTYSGLWIRPLDPRPEEIDILDICHALSNQCRFTGHVSKFYSVAEHSCRVHDIVPDEFKLDAILHDASEYVLMDLARPVKEQDEMELFRKAEDKLMHLIAEKYGFRYPLPGEVKAADRILLITEVRDLMNPHAFEAGDLNGYKPLSEQIRPWSPVEAKTAMIDRLIKLGVL